MTETERAYLAGIVDGEGSICGVLQSLTINLTISQKYPELLNWIQEKVPSGRIIEFKTNCAAKTPAYKIWWNGRGVISVLELVRPYLVLKKLECEIALTLANMIRHGATHQGERELRAILIGHLQRLSLKGKREQNAISETP